MAKKFRLSKSFFAGSSSGSRRLSKAAKGKGIAKSLDVDTERALILDDMSPEDFGSDWVLPSRLAKARVAAEAKFRELFDSAYEPWEEVRGRWDHSDSEDMDVEDREFPTQSCGGFFASTNFHIGESSRTTATLEACEAVETGCLGVVSTDPCAIVSSGCAATPSKIDCCVPVSDSRSSGRFVWSEGPRRKLQSGGGGLFRHRPKKVIMGRDFLLVRRSCYVHKDLKTTNVLLDSELRAKIANFGLARSADGQEGEFALTRHIVGTKGYMAPEYLENGFISTKIDVYAFGVLLLEILTGKEVSALYGGVNGHLSDVLSPVIHEENGKENLGEFMDPSLQESYPAELAVFVAGVADSCIKNDPSARPGMAEIVQSLSRIMTTSLNWEKSKTVSGYHSFT